MTQVRKGQAPDMLERGAFHERFMQQFFDPAYEAEQPALSRLEEIAWQAYREGRKAPRTAKAGPGFADPGYDLSIEWREAHDKLVAAQQAWSTTPSRVLVVCSAPRNDGTCPGEISKTWRLSKIACEVLEQAGIEADLLDLSRLTSDYDRHIHPCKGCVSTAMPLCHWPCSCYPNHATRQTGDWMNEIFERWVKAHGVILLTPVHWYQTASPLKLMMDRMVCADGGNPDPTSTQGKNAEMAKALELAGWDYPKHLQGRCYGVVVHGDVAGIETVRRVLEDWLDWMGLIDAGFQARLERFIGYYEPYATSHDELDKDEHVQEEVRNVARAVVNAVKQLRVGKLQRPDRDIRRVRAK
ncbi:flavodoxin family protein [Ramlibacter albus]|uniref:Flavodoxin family protein n=1 Tax=Ramlibacter albus TaxID=2079448 RepID=A0A923S176_9BURK|nr:flavodoxin family protein [Ramlibacter albus]MBC5764000.1 flavodoxin family protein [Ramlibacter albus]